MKAAAILAFIAFIFTNIAAWFTHVIWCITNAEYLFLLVGAIVAPVGTIHGWMLWF